MARWFTAATPRGPRRCERFSDGLLKTSAGDLLPFNTAGLANANDAHIFPDSELFLAGDVRANENVELTALQTLFMREHNYQAGLLKAAHPTWTDEQLFQGARAIVIGEIQSITYNEFLPALLGNNALTAYRGYNANVNVGNHERVFDGGVSIRALGGRERC